MKINRTQFQQTVLPLLLMGVALGVLNLGLYTVLTENPVPVMRLALPYTDAFTADHQADAYASFGGDWEVRDEQLVQINTVGFDLGTLIPVEAAPDTTYRYEVDLRHLGEDWGGGLIFNAQHLNSRQQSHMVRFNVDAGTVYVIYGVFGDNSDFAGQGSAPVDVALGDRVRLGVMVSPNNYRVLLDGEPLTDGIPLAYTGGAVGLITSGAQVAFDNVAVTVADPPSAVAGNTPPAPPATTSAGMLVFADDFMATEGGASPWTPFAGEWAFLNGALRQETLDGFDFATGNVTVLPSTYTYTVTFQHQTGQGGGLLFNMAAPDTRAGAHMVRYVHDADFLTWGYFDADNRYTGQGSAPVPAPGSGPHTLSVIVTPSDYQIVLDGEVVTGAVPLVADGDYIGLVTAQSIVDFTAVDVLAAGAVVVDAPTPQALVEPVGTSGAWSTVGGVTVQTATEETDHIAGTGFAAEAFALDVVITHDAGSGGGIVFHAAERDAPALGTMVRFDETSDVLFWGQYAADGTFTGLGSTPVTVAPGTPVALRLVVRGDTFDILLDGALLVGDIPVGRGTGWIGLVSYSGTVSFADLQLSREIGEPTP